MQPRGLDRQERNLVRRLVGKRENRWLEFTWAEDDKGRVVLYYKHLQDFFWTPFLYRRRRLDVDRLWSVAN